MRFDERLDPELALMIDSIPRLDFTDVATARTARAALAAQGRAQWTGVPGVSTEDVAVPPTGDHPGVTVRVYRPEQRPAAPVAALVWTHGGGHVIGTVDQDDPLLARTVADTGCVAVSVDWRRAPENPYPAAVEDAYAALAWLHANADGLGVDRARVAVGGASSGGGLAAGLALLARDRGDYPVAHQLLIYPMLDDRDATASTHAVTHPHIWNRGTNRLAWSYYLGDLDGADDVPIYAAPSRAVDLSGLPPAWIATGELDVFADEDIDYAVRLSAAGVSAELHVYAGGFHGFDVFAPGTALSRRFFVERDAALHRVLGPARS